MRILLLTHAFNSLSQRLFVDLREAGHTVSVEFDINDTVSREAVALFRPDVVIAPFLKRAIPEDIWREVPCLIVHPGPPGDRGPSALDWAIMEDASEWGVTLLQANAEMDAGDIWASRRFTVRPAAKGSLYRTEVTAAAVLAVQDGLAAFHKPGFRAASLDYDRPDVTGRSRPALRQSDRAIDWARDDTDCVLRKIRAADGDPGVLDDVNGTAVYLFDAHREDRLNGPAGAILARRGKAICRGTRDGAVWIGHLRSRTAEPTLKLPATMVLGDVLATTPETRPHDGETYRDIWYEERQGVGYLHFAFYNGAMGATDCDRLREAFRRARQRPTRVIVLMGGSDFWSNGLDLNLIEDSDSPADESWHNINAIDDLILDIITADTHYVIAAIRGNAGAGGAFMALAADLVLARSGVVLNPHYKGMGNLYGSEYWTYLLPRRAGLKKARQATDARLPMGTPEATRIGLVDDTFGSDITTFDAELSERARDLADDTALSRLLEEKRRRLRDDQDAKPLERYRAEELEHMKLNFYGFDPSYHVARHNFVYKIPKSRTPPVIASHRRVCKPHFDGEPSEVQVVGPGPKILAQAIDDPNEFAP